MDNSKPIDIYARISEDPLGLGIGVERQVADCKAYLTARGLPIGKVLIDNDSSAYKRGAKRKGFKELIDRLESGISGGIMSYDLDRLTRQPIELDRLLINYERDASLFFATLQGQLNLSTTDGRFVARILVDVANKSSGDTARRVGDQARHRAAAGIQGRGGNRAFGWTTEWGGHVPAEGELLCQAKDDHLAGMPMNTGRNRWNRAGIRTTAGNGWSRQSYKRTILSCVNAGIVCFKGEPLMTGGQYVFFTDDAYYTPDEWLRLRAKFDKKRGRFEKGKPKYLLSGLCYCGLDGSPMRGNARPGGHGYKCDCGRVGISGAKLDALITDLFLADIRDRKIVRREKPWLGEERLIEIDHRISQLLEQYQSPNEKERWEAEIVFPAVNRLREERKTLLREKEEWYRQHATIVPEDVGQLWPTLELWRRREAISVRYQMIVVGPAPHRGGQFDPARVKVVPR